MRVCASTEGNQIPSVAVARVNPDELPPRVARLRVDLREHVGSELACGICTRSTFH